MRQASNNLGRPIEYPDYTEQLLDRAGFSSRTHQTIRVPIPSYLGDKFEHELCSSFRAAIVGPGDDRTSTLVGMSMVLLTYHLGWAEDYVRQTCQDTLDMLFTMQSSVYFNM
jgi:hypothetical protein